MIEVLKVIKDNAWLGTTILSGSMIIPSVFMTYNMNTPVPLIATLWTFILGVTMSTINIFKERCVTFEDLNDHLQEEKSKSKARSVFYDFTAVMMSIGMIMIVLYSISFLISF